jgi:hypothetical protein
MPKVSSELAPLLFEYRCKICQMARSCPDIFKDLHTQVLEVGSSLNRAMNFINARIDQEQIPIPKLNNQNMAVHFASHISLPERVNVELSKNGYQTQPALKDVNPEMGYFIEDMVRRKVGNEVNDYLNLDSLRARMDEKLELLDTIIEKDVNGTKVIDVPALQIYSKLVSEIRACIVDLNKIRQGKQLMNTIIQSLIEKYVFEVARQLTKEYDQVQKDLVENGLSDTEAIKITQNLKMQAATIVAQTARNAVADVLRAYKLG